MTRIKIKKLVGALFVCGLPAFVMSGCICVKNQYQKVFGVDESVNESTGYYSYLDAQLSDNKIVVPEGLDNPGRNSQLKVPSVNPDTLKGNVGEKVDVRPPAAPYRADFGSYTQWIDNEAIVWFEKDGSHGIRTEDDAWMLIDSMLRTMKVGIGEVSDGQYVLTTVSSDFTDYGKPYSELDEDNGILRYRQIYQLRVGRNSANEIGIASRLLASGRFLSNGYSVNKDLSPIEQERFTMGFSNNIIHALNDRFVERAYDPENLVITLGKDNNGHDAILVEAPFDTTNMVLVRTFPRIGWSVTAHSVAKAQYDIEVLDSSDEQVVYTNSTSLDIDQGTYKIRVGIHGNMSAITLYDKDDAPVPYEVVSRIYQGFAQVMSAQFVEYTNNQANVVKAK